LSGRLLWMSTQFDPPPVFSEPEGAVAAGTELVMSSPSRLAIFFTTDGSDPTEGGASVQRYTRSFTLSEATWVKARTRRSNGDWGALETARYVVDETPVLVVSEIHYRPSAASSAEAALGFSRNDFEFLELTNPGSADIDLTGAEFTEGLTFTFGPTVIAPGGSVILVADLAAFESRYGTAPLPIAGEYEGGLDNDGETLTIEDRDRRVLLSFTYNDAAPWPTEADGSGPSLTLALPSLSPDDPESWRASLATGGSPGQLDSIIFTGDPSADEDGNGVNDLVEYAVVGSITYTEHSSPDLINLSYTRRMGTDSAEVIIQVSDDLIPDSWTSVTAAPTSRDSHGDATETLTFSLPRDDRGFARLLVRLR